jgi:glucose-6-phosphate isomerase
MSESIGKATDLRGKPQRTGITPVTSIGSVDLHGFSQLTFAGPRDKTTCFVGLKEFSSGPHIKQQSVFSKYTSPTITHTPGEILGAIYEGTKRAYAKDKIPFTEVTFKKISEASLGTFMQWKMVEVMLLGKLMNINAFNQPNVESYKEETRKILKGRLA